MMSPNRMPLFVRLPPAAHKISLYFLLAIGAFLIVFQAQAVFIRVGPFSLSVYATALSALVITVGLVPTLFSSLVGFRIEGHPARDKALHLLVVLSPLGALLLYSAARLASEWRLEGAQNVLALFILVGGIALFALRPDKHDYSHIAQGLIYLSMVVATIFIVFTIANIPGFANRQFAMIMLVPLAVAVTIPPSDWVLRLSPFLFVFAISISQSRTATAIAIAMLFYLVVNHLRTRHSRLERGLVASGFVVAAIAPLMIFALRLNSWAIENPDVASRGRLSSSGRWRAWGEFVNLLEGPLDWAVGLGTGKAMQYGADNIPFFPHPHNEYLRFLVDTGILGVGLLAVGAIVLLVELGKKWNEGSYLQRSSFILILALGLMSSTDGALYSSFVVVPAAIVIGLGLGQKISHRHEFL